jgi:endonuclease-3
MNKQKAIKIIKKLKKAYPDAKCSLDFSTPFEMLVAVSLSAQCTDDRVNKITPTLFEEYSTPQDFKNADITKLEELVHSCGFYKNKAKNIKAAGEKVVNDFNNEVPKTLEELITIPGVGRKSANVIMLEAFNLPVGIAVDTHVKRLSNRIGFSNESDPYKIELELLNLIPKQYYKDVNHILIWHGRNTCTAQNPKCENCPIYKECENKPAI